MKSRLLTSKRCIRQPKLVLVGGPSGIGVTAILDFLTSKLSDCYAHPVAYTSRQQRPAEGDSGYRFTSYERISDMFHRGLALNLDSAYGDAYAISLESVEAILAGGCFAVEEVDPANHARIRAKVPDLVSVLLIPLDLATEKVLGDTPRAPGRERGSTEDASFYQHLDTSPFDVVLPVGPNVPVEQSARALHLYLSAVGETDDLFPRPPVIDEENRLGYDRIAPEFSDSLRITTSNFHSLSAGFFQDQIRSWLCSGSECLEIGPGTGWLRECCQWPPVSYSTADISTRMLASSCPQGDVDKQTLASARSLPFPSGSIDAVLASLADPYCYPIALCEMNRVLRPGGFLILSSPSRHWSDACRHGGHPQKTQFRLSCGAAVSVYSFTFGLDELVGLLALCGFTTVQSCVYRGDSLPCGSPVSPAIVSAARNAGIEMANLELLNCVVCVKNDIHI